MISDYTYLISLMDETTQEPIVLIAKGQRAIELILSRKPEHHTLMNVSNVGTTIDGDDYLKSLTDNGLNFGQQYV